MQSFRNHDSQIDPLCRELILERVLGFATGAYNPFKLNHANKRKLEKYGPLVRETIMGRSYLLVFNPEDIARVFKFETKYPYRETLLSLKEYRVRKHSTTCDPNAGLIVT